MPPRRDGSPVLVNPSGSSHRLPRVELSGRSIHEGFLQRLLFQHPEVLPVERIDPSFGPLIPVWGGGAREIGTSVGPTDAVYVSPNGLITIVETKLWRNPEARREVVGQIINYATEVGGWSYEELDARVRKSSGKGLWESVTDGGHGGDDVDEAEFVDAVSESLRRGRLLLIVAGDGIREDVERMAAFLQGAPQLHFTLALVELKLYQLEDGSTLVVPSVVARTTEVVRAVVRVQGSAPVSVSLDLQEPSIAHVGSNRRPSLSEEGFLQALHDGGTDPNLVAFVETVADEYRDEPYYLAPMGASLMMKLHDPSGAGNDLTLFGITKGGLVMQGHLHAQLRRRLDPELERLALDTSRGCAELLGAKAGTDKNGNVGWAGVPLGTFRERYEHFKARLEPLVSHLVGSDA